MEMWSVRILLTVAWTGNKTKIDIINTANNKIMDTGINSREHYDNMLDMR